MVEVVQTIAPQLTTAQIRYDLQTSGSVEATIERFMELGTLPFPPGEEPPSIPEPHVNKASKASGVNLIEKYGLQEKARKQDEGFVETDDVVATDGADIVNKRKEEMILNARRRLAKQLRNEVI